MNSDLLERIEARTAHALETGALQPIRTESTVLEEAGVRFLVRALSSLVRKDEANKEEAGAARDSQASPTPPLATKPAAVARVTSAPTSAPLFDPFADPEADLVLEREFTGTHYLLLNKFNVMERHLLIVTRAFEPQEALVGEADFDALARCLAQVDGLGFYNAGREAGASQPHKHLQLVPMDLPMEPILGAFQGPQVGRIAALPFCHSVARLSPVVWERPAAALTRLYREMLRGHGIGGVAGLHGEEHQSAPYNLLVTRRWMMVVPRARERFENVPVSAPAYAGSLFVRRREDIERIRAHGVLNVLRDVGIAWRE